MLVIYKDLQSDPCDKNNFMELSRRMKISGYDRNKNQCQQQAYIFLNHRKCVAKSYTVSS